MELGLRPGSGVPTPGRDGFLRLATCEVRRNNSEFFQYSCTAYCAKTMCRCNVVFRYLHSAHQATVARKQIASRFFLKHICLVDACVLFSLSLEKGKENALELRFC